MKATINYKKGIMRIDGKNYQIEDFKTFLIINYPALVKQFYVKAIRSFEVKQEVNRTVVNDLRTVEITNYQTGRTAFMYDWAEIFRRAEKAVFPIYHFIK